MNEEYRQCIDIFIIGFGNLKGQAHEKVNEIITLNDRLGLN
jgi:hypothetical protein